MEEFAQSVRAIRFGVFQLDLRSRELRKRGIKLKLQGQPFRILVTLLTQPGEVVTREELRRKLWPEDTFIDFDHSLGTAVNKLREVLGDSADNPRFIETLPRQGYRFIAPTEILGESESPAVADGSPPGGRELATADPVPPIDLARIDVSDETVIRVRSRRSFPWKISAIAILLVLAALSVWILYPWSRPPSHIRSLAVLPLENLSADSSQDYFSDGMTDELITALGKLPELRVISRTSVMTYKGVHRPLPQIARELNVEAVVEGTVLRAGNRVRITAQLIQASTDKHLWAESYESELRDTLALQATVAGAIAEQIRMNLSPQRHIAVNPEAYDAYLKGRYFWNQRTADGLKKALESFNEAIEKDPNYAPAYTGLADTYALLGDWQYGALPPKEAYPRARAAASKALELDSTLGEAHISLAFSIDGYDWDWASSEREFRQGIELSPGYATGHQWYAAHLMVLGRNSDAIAEIRKAARLDPLSLIINTDLAEDFLIFHRYDEAIQQSRKTIDLDPHFAAGHYVLGEALVQKHLYDNAIAELQTAVALSGNGAQCTANLAYAYAASGRRDEAVKILNDLKARSKDGFSDAPEIAVVYVGLEEKEQAMAWLEKAYAERFNPGVLMRPSFDPVRSEPRFQDLLRRIGIKR